MEKSEQNFWPMQCLLLPDNCQWCSMVCIPTLCCMRRLRDMVIQKRKAVYMQRSAKESASRRTGFSNKNHKGHLNGKVVVQSLSHVQLFATHELQPSRLLCPWAFPGKNTGVGCQALLLQGIFLIGYRVTNATKLVSVHSGKRAYVLFI